MNNTLTNAELGYMLQEHGWAHLIEAWDAVYFTYEDPNTGAMLMAIRILAERLEDVLNDAMLDKEDVDVVDTR